MGYDKKEIDRLRKISNGQQPICLFAGFSIWEDPVYGDEAQLILKKDNQIIAQDLWEVSDYMNAIQQGKY